MDNEAQTIADLAVKAKGEPLIISTSAGREFLILPDRPPQDVTEPNAIEPNLPAHISQVVTLQTVDSLVAYVDRFKAADTHLFADIQANRIKAVLDYHGPHDADHGAHIATMDLPYSEEWKLWTGIDDKRMGQLEFARFLEENAQDIAAPSGASLLEVCRDLQAIRKADFRKAVRTNSDNESFEYSEETEATSRATGKSVEVPTKFQLAIPVYFGGGSVALFASLRWGLDDGKLMLGVKLQRREQVRQAVFKQIVEDVASRTERPAVFGKLGN